MSSSSRNNPAFLPSLPLPALTALTATTATTTTAAATSVNCSSSSNSPIRRLARSAVASPPPPTRPPTRSPQPSQHPSSPCTPIVGRDALQAALTTYPPSTPIIVFFHARWCRVCKTLAYKLPKVAEQFPSLVWLDVDFATLQNKALCSQLDVRLLPTFRVYHGGALDTDSKLGFTTGPFGAKTLVDRLQEYFHGL